MLNADSISVEIKLSGALRYKGPVVSDEDLTRFRPEHREHLARGNRS